MTDIDIQVATEEDAHLPTFDNTKLTAINTCPMWGIIRYDQHKRMPNAGRAMALEAGSACHELFAAVRLYTIREEFPEHFLHHMHRVFGPVRAPHMIDVLDAYKNEDDRTRMMNFALYALETSGFYDDPKDRYRTLTNLEASCIAYMDRINLTRPVYIEDHDNPACLIGVEIPFALRINFGDGCVIRFVGRMDGLHHKNGRDDPRLEIQENKTASRLGDAWEMSFRMSHQVTGYAVAAAAMSGQSVEFARVIGLATPQPRTTQFGGFTEIPVRRHSEHIGRWLSWMRHTISIWEQYRHNIQDSPRYTHSCNRYFRPCSLIPLCDAPEDEFEQIFNMMEHDEWSPLDEVSEA
jgi:hypothetical protein